MSLSRTLSFTPAAGLTGVPWAVYFTANTIFPKAEVLARWLQLSDTDLAGLQDQMSQRQASTVMSAGLRCGPNSLREVEVCAVAVPDGQMSCWGFTVRELPRLN